MGKRLQLLEHVSLVCIFILVTTEAQQDDKECEVCVATLEKFTKRIPEGVEHTPGELETKLRSFCKEFPVGGKENRFCYFIGATDDAATRTILDVVGPLSYGLPPKKICQQLRAKDSQICDIKFDVRPDFQRVNKMKIGELRKILDTWGEGMACVECLEKADYVKMVKKLMAKYEPEEWEKLQAAEKAELEKLQAAEKAEL